MTAQICDFLVIGAGLPGLALAAELAGHGRVIVVEREAHPGYHATGRSAAIFSGSYGAPAIHALSMRSRRILEAFPTVEGDRSVLSSRGLFYVAFRGDTRATVDHMDMLEYASIDDVCRAVPVLRPDMVLDARYEVDAADIDVHAMQTGYLHRIRGHGGQILTGAEVLSACRRGAAWQVELQGGTTVTAAVVIDAAGAWAGKVAGLFGAPDPGLTPLRRSAAIVDGPDGVPVSGWPMIVNADETLYFKPEGGRLMVSPADEEPVEPHDAYADDMEIAVAIDRLTRVTTLDVRRVRTPWAGLRTFASDALPVIGFDACAEGFFWLAGQGGFGIQTAPGAAQLAARAILEQGMGEEDRQLLRQFSPARFADAVS